MADPTMQELKDAFNGLAAKFNDLLTAFQDGEAARAVQAQEFESLKLSVRQLAAAPPAPALGIDMAQLLERMAAVESRTTGIPMNPMQAKEFQAAALRRESVAHGQDKMMYHSDPAAKQPWRIIHNDAEELAAMQAGYHPTLEQAAKITLGKEAANPEAVAAQIEKLRANMNKAA